MINIHEQHIQYYLMYNTILVNQCMCTIISNMVGMLKYAKVVYDQCTWTTYDTLTVTQFSNIFSNTV